MATKAEITGSFLGRMLFKFVLMCVLWAVSIIMLNNYMALPNSGSQIATRNDSGGYASVIISSIGIAVSGISLLIIVLVDINGSKVLEPAIFQGQDFCMDDTGRLTVDNSKRVSNGIQGGPPRDDQMANIPGMGGV